MWLKFKARRHKMVSRPTSGFRRWNECAVDQTLVLDASQSVLVPYLARVARSIIGDVLFGRSVVFALVEAPAIARVLNVAVDTVGSEQHRTVRCNTNNDHEDVIEKHYERVS